MNFETILNAIVNFQIGGLVKLFLMTVLAFYLVFAVVVFRQVVVMTQIVETEASFMVKMVALFQIFACVLLFGLGLFLI